MISHSSIKTNSEANMASIKIIVRISVNLRSKRVYLQNVMSIHARWPIYVLAETIGFIWESFSVVSEKAATYDARYTCYMQKSHAMYVLVCISFKVSFFGGGGGGGGAVEGLGGDASVCLPLDETQIYALGTFHTLL